MEKNLFDIFKKLLKEFENEGFKLEDGLSNLPNSFSISYKFKTGMDKPKINFSGNLPSELQNEFYEKILKNKIFKNMMKNDSNFGNKIAVDNNLFVDIFEEDNKLHVIVEIPGVSKEEINLSLIDDSTLELQYNKNIKQIKLPIKIKSKIKPKAKYNNGILEITLEKLNEINLRNNKQDIKIK